MQVVLQTPSELVIHDGRWHTVLLGALFLTFGAGALWLVITHPTGWSGNAGPWLVYLVGALFVLAGCLIFWFSADRRYVIDKSDHTVSMVVQLAHLHRQTSVIPFQDIDDVVLEESADTSRSSGQGSSTFRVVFLMKDGTRKPWTPYLTNERVSQERCAAAARVFGGWSGNPDHRVEFTSPPPALVAHPAATNWGPVALFLSVFAAAGIGMFCVEVYRVAIWKPVTANVIAADIETVRGDKGGNTYAPAVDYTYVYEGRTYRSNGVLPVKVSAGYGWAQSISSRFRPGSSTVAYVDPSNPAKAFLVARISLIPLAFVAFPLFAGLFFAWIVRMQRAPVEFAEHNLVPVIASKGRDIMKLALFAFVAFAASATAQQRPSGRTVIANVTVVDVRTGALRAGMSVLIDSGRIVQTAAGEIREGTRGAARVDGTGKYLIPGLWDMHVHLAFGDWFPGARDIDFPLFIANGVTGVRDMGSDVDSVFTWRKEIDAGRLLGPRIITSGPMLDGPKPRFPASVAIATPEDGRRAVRMLKQRGVDFIKLQSLIPREAVFAIADEAKKEHIPFVGHVPDAVRASEMSNAGQKSFEHLIGVFEGSSPRRRRVSQGTKGARQVRRDV